MISDQLNGFKTIFIDTAPIIYFIEAHPVYGSISKTIDAIQLAAAIFLNADVFITNDKKLKAVKEIRILILADYILRV